MRNKQDIADYKKFWIASYLAMTDNRLTLRLLHNSRLPVIARYEAIQKVQLVYIINFPSLRINNQMKRIASKTKS
jgi:hypothetical protein